MMRGPNPLPTECKSRLQMTEQRGKLLNLVQIKSTDKKSIPVKYLTGSTSHKGGVPFPLNFNLYALIIGIHRKKSMRLYRVCI